MEQNFSLDDRRDELALSMPGFTGLIEPIQGMLVSWSLTTGEIWTTPDVGRTRSFARSMVTELSDLVAAYGVEQ